MGIPNINDLPYYTSDDYEQWQGHWELINGVPYAMSPAPSIIHQQISQKIAAQLENVLTNCKHCQALLPVDWKISEDTIVQPDNLVVCHSITGQYLTQAPTVIFEILSPSSAKKDQGLKFELYQKEGVAYYVIVNPATTIAKVYQLTEDGRLVKKQDAQHDQFQFNLKHCTLDFDFSKIW